MIWSATRAPARFIALSVLRLPDVAHRRHRDGQYQAPCEPDSWVVLGWRSIRSARPRRAFRHFGAVAEALNRQLGTSYQSYRTAWLMHQKLMRTMALKDDEQPLSVSVQLDDAYLRRRTPGGVGRGSSNKVPIVAAVSTNPSGHPMRVKLHVIVGFTQEAVTRWARTHLQPGTDVRSDGLACFAGVIEAACTHSWIVVGARKPRELPQFNWVNTILGNLKTTLHGAHKAFDFAKYATHYLGSFAYRFNRRFDPRALFKQVLADTTLIPPAHERRIRGGTEVHD